MNCAKCQRAKLACEFPEHVTELCAHAPGVCLECLYKRFTCGYTTCEECTQPVEIDVRQALIDQHRQLYSVNAVPQFRTTSLLVSTMDGVREEIPYDPNMHVSALRVAIAARMGVPAKKQRLVCNKVVLQDVLASGLEARLRDSNIVEGSFISLLILPYSAFAGQASIEGAATDAHGNIAGNQYDLGDDNAFAGEIIAVLHLYTGEGFDFALPTAALKAKGFRIVRWADTPPTADILRSTLSTACQLWIISHKVTKLSTEHVRVIADYMRDGHGIYVWGDNCPFYMDANVICQELFGVGHGLTGNDRGNTIVPEAKKPSDPGFIRHAVTTGLVQVYEGDTIATVVGTKLTPVMRGSSGNVVTAMYERNGQRAVVDGGFTRLFCNWDQAGTSRFVVNMACWLANCERMMDEDRWPYFSH